MSNDILTLESADFTINSIVLAFFTQKSKNSTHFTHGGLFITEPFLKADHGLTKHGTILTLAELDAD